MVVLLRVAWQRVALPRAAWRQPVRGRQA